MQKDYKSVHMCSLKEAEQLDVNIVHRLNYTTTPVEWGDASKPMMNENMQRGWHAFSN